MEGVEIRTNPTRLKTLVVGSKVFRSSNDCELSPEDVEKARLELGETEEIREISLRTLKEMLSREATRYRTDDAYLLRFLRCKKFKCEETHKMVSYFYSVRRDYPDVYYSLPADLEALLNTNLFTYLPYRDEDGSIIFLDKLGRWNSEKHSVYDLLQLFQTIADIMTMNPACQISKIVGIFDCEGINVRQLISSLHPSTITFSIKVMQNLQPWRIKYVIILNCNRFIRTLLNLIRHLLKKKIADRILVLDSDTSELHKYVSPAILPKEYGGILEEGECNITQHIMDNLPYLRYEHSFRNAKKL